MYESALTTAHGEIEVCALVDEDDETRKDYPTGPRYTIREAGPITTDIWNQAIEPATGDVFMLAADDIIFRTDGWDMAVYEALDAWPDGMGMVYVNDGHEVHWKPPVVDGWVPGPDAFQLGMIRWRNHRGSRFVFPTHPFLPRRWVEIAGFLTPPYFSPTWEADNWIQMVAGLVGRVRYLPDVLIEHMHPMSGKAKIDATYQAGAWVNRKLWDAAKKISYSPEKYRERTDQACRILDALHAG